MVEEDEFRSTYNAVNQRRCGFEKAILSRHCACLCATRFFLADREGVSCESASAQQRCLSLLELMRNNARFALKLTSIEGKLPHNKEIRVQNGGMSGLQQILYPQLQNRREVDDITGLIAFGLKIYGSLEKFPFQQITQSIASHEGRKRRPRSDRN
jgi:hypothetical protein